jgi:RNA polymerase sigma-70 factor (ECF subfamily)
MSPSSEHRARLVNFFRSRVATRDDAEDLAQDVLLRAHQRASSLDDAARFDAWLFAIARNALTDHYRRNGRAKPHPDDLTPAPEDDDGSGRAELAGCVKPFLARLKDEDREALTRVELRGEKQVDVARDLGLSASGMKSRVQRARRRLLQEMLDCCDVKTDARGRPVEVIGPSCC